ncbi:hypothetical protein A3I27_01390 [Candidatus Giovannonibacteria bacterium RIFCSPLOWO2_02_FULL_43_11b]|uniref:Uncharacterized protein n=1 Tax=Candidatus Giovannonibacteria bacterium RIFCSPHIGHO2_12_FULL_43_15 TaxID=1798341 RepID=A0A1F5WP88_9BACT|nr:MAG: hypothetical protein A2739_03040 [Candidatus Giovannonibacteria bacterium RIFCSPHIGHO2_01_FULL_43_100]OGF66692.1 MAG: hypothetical protein A3B97_02130 [Candidatus Giovannonibacteria bacterium RIFCSPHIGHO2_02_FULL_43_32]OGF77468.1 MAG: hypothetical protein A3F23_00625 [Candidatus Giovannonibacteria bacterium RIFCSPHIGHO2_12_FULL_43_15]OGF78839.1 MAG: hypothetical protein A3A15_00025 [Candidatus Giovannonibacteria bacterium RIFCSPLOWO2_01_FULL_43_60]OGF90264.1 MAG: hypothetical protein A3
MGKQTISGTFIVRLVTETLLEKRGLPTDRSNCLTLKQLEYVGRKRKIPSTTAKKHASTCMLCRDEVKTILKEPPTEFSVKKLKTELKEAEEEEAWKKIMGLAIADAVERRVACRTKAELRAFAKNGSAKNDPSLPRHLAICHYCRDELREEREKLPKLIK